MDFASGWRYSVYNLERVILFILKVKGVVAVAFPTSRSKVRRSTTFLPLRHSIGISTLQLCEVSRPALVAITFQHQTRDPDLFGQCFPPKQTWSGKSGDRKLEENIRNGGRTPLYLYRLNDRGWEFTFRGGIYLDNNGSSNANFLCLEKITRRFPLDPVEPIDDLSIMTR